LMILSIRYWAITLLGILCLQGFGQATPDSSQREKVDLLAADEHTLFYLKHKSDNDGTYYGGYDATQLWQYDLTRDSATLWGEQKRASAQEEEEGVYRVAVSSSGQLNLGRIFKDRAVVPVFWGYRRVPRQGVEVLTYTWDIQKGALLLKTTEGVQGKPTQVISRWKHPDTDISAWQVVNWLDWPTASSYKTVLLISDTDTLFWLVVDEKTTQDTYTQLLNTVGLGFHRKQSPKSIPYFQAATREGGAPITWFNLACAQAQQDDYEKAIESLQHYQSLDPAGFRQRAHKDADLKPLRELPDFQKLLK